MVVDAEGNVPTPPPPPPRCRGFYLHRTDRRECAKWIHHRVALSAAVFSLTRLPRHIPLLLYISFLINFCLGGEGGEKRGLLVLTTWYLAHGVPFFALSAALQNDRSLELDVVRTNDHQDDVGGVFLAEV